MQRSGEDLFSLFFFSPSSSEGKHGAREGEEGGSEQVSSLPLPWMEKKSVVNWGRRDERQRETWLCRVRE